jgi:hypothetical protein
MEKIEYTVGEDHNPALTLLPFDPRDGIGP